MTRTLGFSIRTRMSTTIGMRPIFVFIHYYDYEQNEVSVTMTFLGLLVIFVRDPKDWKMYRAADHSQSQSQTYHEWEDLLRHPRRPTRRIEESNLCVTIRHSRMPVWADNINRGRQEPRNCLGRHRPILSSHCFSSPNNSAP
jgi:hypothetical protein